MRNLRGERVRVESDTVTGSSSVGARLVSEVPPRSLPHRCSLLSRIPFPGTYAGFLNAHGERGCESGGDVIYTGTINGKAPTALCTSTGSRFIGGMWSWVVVLRILAGVDGGEVVVGGGGWR